jgi:hypothetical protein
VEQISCIIKNGALQQKIDTIQLLQTLDYNYLTQDDKTRGHILDNMESLATGLNHYVICRDDPEQYRIFAGGFRKQERIAPKRIVPDDGMHKALRSHIKHIETRLSPMLQPEENEFIEAQRDLAVSARKEYAILQETVLCRDDDSHPSK